MFYMSEGIVLKRVKVSDYDKILTVFTLKHGKVSGSVRGSQNPKSKLSAGSHPFVYGEFTFQKSGRMSNISSIDIIKSFYKLRENLDALTLASYFLELVASVTVENEPNDSLFYVLIEYLQYTEDNDNIDALLKLKVSFELKLLSNIGLTPELDHCIHCGGTFENPKFSVEDGGLVCENCYHVYPNDYRIGHTLPKLMKFFIQGHLDQIFEVDVNDKLLKKVSFLNDKFFEYYLGKRGIKGFKNLFDF